MFERLSRSWSLVKASAAVLAQDRKLLLFPLISVHCHAHGVGLVCATGAGLDVF